MRLHRSLPTLALTTALASGCTAEPVQIASNTSSLEVDKVDILLVVDDSGSMESLQRELPSLLRALVAGSDEPGAERPPLTDLHLGVVSTNMGVSQSHTPAGIALCEGLGDDGVFRRLRAEDLLACDFDTPAFLSFEGDEGSVATLDTAACIPTLGTQGCGFEQPLESMLKALWPSADDGIDFVEGSPHGDRENAGFLREDSLLLVIAVTDEDDCSASDPDIFLAPSLGGPLDDVPPNLRCPLHTDYLYEVERYVDALRSLREGDDPVMFALIGGIPSELVDADAQASVDWDDADAVDAFYDGVLEHPAMQPTADPSRTDGAQHILPSCTKPNGGPAFPAPRLVEVAKRFGRAGVLGSVCAEDFSETVAHVIRAAADNL